MAKRRSDYGKIRKHGRSEPEYPYEPVSGSKKARRFRYIMIGVIIGAIIVSAELVYVFFIWEAPSDEEEVWITTDSPFMGGDPGKNITFDFTIHNPDKESDIYSPMITDFPSTWDINLPSTINVEGESSKRAEFTIAPPVGTLNKTHHFFLNITSASTQQTYSLEYDVAVFHVYHGIEIICFNNTHHADPGNSTQYSLIIENLGNGDDTITLSYTEGHLPAGWTVDFDFDTIDIPALASRAVICNITTASTTSKGRYDIRVTAASAGGPSDSTSLNTSLVLDFDDRGLAVGDRAQVHYIGYFEDGYIFDTSIEEAANNDNFTKDPDLGGRLSYPPLKIEIGPTDPDPQNDYTPVIEGFWEGVVGMKVNDTRVVRIPADKAYTDPNHNLYGKVLIFEITLMSIDS